MYSSDDQQPRYNTRDRAFHMNPIDKTNLHLYSKRKTHSSGPRQNLIINPQHPIQLTTLLHSLLRILRTNPTRPPTLRTKHPIPRLRPIHLLDSEREILNIPDTVAEPELEILLAAWRHWDEAGLDLAIGVPIHIH